MFVTRPCSTSVFECPCLFSYFGDNGHSAVRLSILSSGPALRFLRILTTTCFGQGRALWALILAALLLPVCVRPCHSQTAHGRDHLSDNISGTVLNSVTREPIGRALVYTLDQRSAAFTDEHGHFELILAVTADMSDPRARAQIHERLQAKKPGFVTEQGRYGSIDVAPDRDDAILSLVPEALIVGHVKFPSAEAADHVQVQLYRREVRNGFGQWAPQTSITTLADGEFRFADLEAGEYKVFTLETTEQDPLANVPNGPVFGFPPRFFAAARDFATADTIQLRAGETVTANIAPERQRYFDVRIPVIKPQVGPGTGLSVSVHAQGHRGPGFELGYDPDQNAIRGSLPNGSYTIEASSNEPDSATGTTAITVANGPVNGPPLALTPNVLIEYNVHQDFSAVESSPIPSPSVSVNLQEAEEFSEAGGGGVRYSTQSNLPALSGVRPGRYWVQVNPSSSDIYVASVSSGGKDLLASPLVVPFGASVPPIEITLGRGSGEIEIAGSFDGSRQTSIYCLPVSGNVSAGRETSGPYIKYSVGQLAPGDYRILAFDGPPQLEYRNPAAMHSYESKGQVVHLTSGQKAQVRLQAIESE